MSSSSSSAPSMTMNAQKSAAPAAKKVAKKEAAAAPAVAAPAPVAAAPVEAAAPKKAAAKKAAAPAAAAPVAAPVVVASTPVEAVAAAPAGPTTTLDEDLKTVTTQLTTLRETVTALLAQVKKLDKRVHREIKDARKRKRRAAPAEGADAKPRQPSIFERPVAVTEELCKFLGKPAGTQMSRSEVTKGVNNYVKEKNLKNKHDITPDAPLKKLLALPAEEKLTYFNLQRYLNRHYVKTTTA